MILVSRKLTANLAKLSEADKNELIEAAKTSPNLLLNTNLSDGNTFWEDCGGEVEGLERAITTINGFMNFTNSFVLAGSANVIDMYGFRQNFYAEPGKYYTGSFYYKFLTPIVSGKNKIRLKVGEDTKTIEQLDNKWHRAELTTVAGQNILEFCVAMVGEQENIMFEFIGAQVEKGKMASDWQLSQQDILNAQQELQESVGLLQEATAPERIIETVVLSEEYKSAMAQKPDYSDLSNFTNKDEVAAEFNRIEQYTQQVANDADAKLSTLSSKLDQSAQDILAQFKMGAGINLIRNSTGFFDTEDWTKTGVVEAIANEELEQKAIGAAFHSEKAFTLTQEVAVKPNTAYSFSFWQKKTTTGKAVIKLMSGSKTLYEIGHADNTTANFDNPFIVNFITEANQSSLKIVMENTEGTNTYFSGLMLNEGSVALQWSSHSQEIANTNIRFNLNGIYVKNQSTGTYTIMSPTEFSGYAPTISSSGVESIERIFTLNGSTTEIFDLDVKSKMTLGGMAHFVPLSSTDKEGLALFM